MGGGAFEMFIFDLFILNTSKRYTIVDLGYFLYFASSVTNSHQWIIYVSLVHFLYPLNPLYGSLSHNFISCILWIHCLDPVSKIHFLYPLNAVIISCITCLFPVSPESTALMLYHLSRFYISNIQWLDPVSYTQVLYPLYPLGPSSPSSMTCHHPPTRGIHPSYHPTTTR